MNKHLKTYYRYLNRSHYPSDSYLFDRAEKGNIPPSRLQKNEYAKTITTGWKRIVKDGLKIAVNRYSNKHAEASAKRMLGMDLDALRERYGHPSKLMTEKYAKVVKEVYGNWIMEHSPDF